MTESPAPEPPAPGTGLRAELAVQLGRLQLHVRLRVAPGETVALLGPNGAGKTTVLRCLAGLHPVDAGRVEMGGVVLDDPAHGVHVPTQRRSIGVVFQDYLLFPHLSALDNVAYGARRSGMRKADARALATRTLGRVGLADHAHHRPAQLSGGQQQRVALARALVLEPHLLLLDEPLAALDAGTRAEVRRDLRQVLDTTPSCRLLITHDPVDAVALADRIVVLEDGRVTQEGTLAQVTTMPRSRYVADLVGTNLYRGTGGPHGVALEGGASLHPADRVDGPVFVLIAPRHVALHRSPPEGSPRNAWPGVVAGVELLADRARVQVHGTPDVVAEITTAALGALGLRPGDAVWVTVKATELDVYAA